MGRPGSTVPLQLPLANAGLCGPDELAHDADRHSMTQYATDTPRCQPILATACRWREAQPGSCKERENLAGDAKGKGSSGSNRKAESTDAPERGGLPRSSDEAAVMVVERRGRAIDDESDQLATGGARSSTEGGSLQSMARAG
jgi:hypothetical protein